MEYRQYFKNTRNVDDISKVTIGAGESGNIYINKFGMKSFFEGIKFVQIFYCEESIAIKPMKKRLDGCYALGFSSNKSQSTGVIGAKGFCSLAFLKQYKGKQLDAVWNDQKELLEVKLKLRNQGTN